MLEYTPEQQACVDEIFSQLALSPNDPARHNVLISGQGGVGKTEMICEAVCTMLTDGKKVAMGTMTGKATSILRGKVHNKIWMNGIKDKFPQGNLLIETLQKITKESKVIGMTTDGQTLFANTWKDPRLFDYDVLIVDELSMVPHYLAQWWQRTNALVIGLGDFCQLPEVNTSDTGREIKSFFHDLRLPPKKIVTGYGVKVLKEMSQCHLTKVLRSENEVALLCNDLRDFTMTKPEAVGVIKGWAAKTPNIQYADSLKALEKGYDWQIICYTNKMCKAINDELCIGGSEYPTKDDKILLCDNIPPIAAFNGETYKFEDLVQRIARRKNKLNNEGRPELFVCFKFNNKMPRPNSRIALEQASFKNYTTFKMEAAAVARDRLEELPGHMFASGIAEAQVKEYLETIEAIKKDVSDPEEAFNTIAAYLEKTDIDMFQYVMERARKMPQLYMVHIEYGYAITTHKSQGSEYEKVCYLLERFDKPLLYTGVSRAKKQVKIIDVTKKK